MEGRAVNNGKGRHEPGLPPPDAAACFREAYVVEKDDRCNFGVEKILSDFVLNSNTKRKRSKMGVGQGSVLGGVAQNESRE